MAGHSKWANIRHRKGVQDAKRGKIFTKLIKEITISARLGGGDIDANPRLRRAVTNAKSNNMPSDKIERAIKKGTGELEGIIYEEVTYEAYGPGGVAIMMDIITDNKNRSVAKVRSTLSKYGGNLAENGCISKIAGLNNLKFIGKAKCFDCEEEALSAVLKNEIVAGAVNSPTVDVKITKDITLGFINSNKDLR